MIKRNTIQCSLVLEAVNKLKSHATADEIYDCIIKEHPTVGRGTVYRNLNRLSEIGKIKKIEVPDGADCFDRRCDAHYHIRCEKCGKVFDVDMKYIPNLADNINNLNGFELTGHDIIFKGICPDCKK